MRGWVADLVYSLRRLLRAPAFTFTVICLPALTMSVAIGLFAIVYDTFYRPLPFTEADRLVFLRIHLLKENADGWFRGADVQSFAHHPEIFERYGAFSENLEWLSNGPGSDPTELHMVYMEPDTYSIFDLHPIAGRLPDTADATARSPRRILVAERFATERFGKAEAAVGQLLPLRSGKYQIIGVLPEFPLFSRIVLWIPALFTPEQLAESAGLGYNGAAIVSRLAAGVSPTEAGRRLTVLASSDPQVVNGPYANDVQVLAAPIQTLWTSPKERLLLLSVLAAALALWLITVSNVCNLYIARLAGRSHESGLMSALGAGTRRILWFHAQDALIIAAAALSIALSLVPLEFLLARLAQMFTGLSPYPLQLDPTSVGFAVLLGLLLAVALVANAWWMERRRTASRDALRIGGTRQSPSREIQFLRTALSVLQVTLTAVLLVGAGLLIRSAEHALHQDLGFDREHLLMTGISLEAPPDPVAFDAVVTRFAERVKALPQAHEMTRSLCNPVGFGGWSTTPYQQPGSEGADIAHWPLLSLCPETEANFFAVLHMPVLLGRSFNDQEVREHAPVAIVDTEFVRQNFPDGHALGRVVRVSASTDTLASPKDATPITALTIVGVVPRVTHLVALLHSDAVHPYLYTPGAHGGNLLLRTNGELGAWRNDLKNAVHGLSPQAMLGYTVFAKEQVANFVQNMYPANSLLSLLAGVTLTLAAVGLYAVLAYSTQMRQKEFAIRLALGESPGGLRRSIVLQGLQWSGLGLLLALPLTWLTGQALESQLYRVQPFDPLTLCAAAIVVAVATLAATWWPARRAARTDPMQALRAE